MSKTTEDWLEDKIYDYNENKTETLENMLSNTTDVIEKYIENISHTTGIATTNALSVLKSCMKHNKLFFQEVGFGGHLDIFERYAKNYFEKNSVTTRNFTVFITFKLNKRMVMQLNEHNKWVEASPEEQREIASSKEIKEFLLA